MEKLSDELLIFWSTLTPPYRFNDDQLALMARELLELRHLNDRNQKCLDVSVIMITENDRLKERLAAAEQVIRDAKIWQEYCDNELGHDKPELTDLRASIKEFYTCK